MISRRVLLSGIGLALLAPAQALAQEVSEFFVERGDHRLFCRLHAPAGVVRYPVMVMVAGSGNESELDGAYTQILARTFNGAGIGLLAYDKRGVGRSTGVYTGSDFAALGDDALHVARHARALAQTESVGMWGISQAGWIIPYAAARASWLKCVILVSPAGVNPHEQVSYFLRTQALSWGLNEEEADGADAMHRAVALYYAGRGDYRAAQDAVDQHRQARWFRDVITHPYWDEMSPEGAILTPEALAAAQRERPGAFEIYMSPSSFMDYQRQYRVLRRVRTLFIYGADDALVPVELSQAAFTRSLGRSRRHETWVFPDAGHDITSADGRLAPNYTSRMGAWARSAFDA